MTVEEVTLTSTTEKKPLFVNTSEEQNLVGIKILYWGEPGTGKTYAGLTFPGPVHVLSTEYGVAQIAQQTGRSDIFRLECTDPFTDKPVKASGDVDDEPFATDPVDSLNKVEEATEWLHQQYKAGAIKGGTVIVDSISDIWSWLANWLDYIAKKAVSKSSGKEYMMRTEWQKANAKYKWIIMRLLALPCNLVMTARSSPVYDAQGNLTAGQKMKAQGETAYYLDIVAHLERQVVSDVTPDGKVSGQKTVRTCTIEKCRLGDVGRLTLSDGTYESLKKGLDGLVPKGTFQ